MEFIPGVKKSVDIRDYVARCTSVKEFPKEFSLFTDKEFPEIKNQGAVGSCVAHSLATLIEYFKYKQDGVQMPMSTSYIYGNRQYSSYKGSGMIIRDAIKATKQMGDCNKESFPYNLEVPTAISLFESRDISVDAIAYPQRIDQYYRLRTENEIKQHLMDVGPVVFAIEWMEPYAFTFGDVLFQSPNAKSCGGHCMIIYGWNDFGWMVQNSWGTTFGNNGRFVLPYITTIEEAWGVTDVPLSEEGGITVV